MVAPLLRWTLGLTYLLLLAGVPAAYHRWSYTHAKRLRVVTPGVLYRGGQMTAAGLDEAIARLKVRTVINVQNESPDPLLDGVPESEFCRVRGVKYVFIGPDLVSRKLVPPCRPGAIDEFLAVMDDPANYPVLLHCRAGLHRTGVLMALYRMEYEGWSLEEAVRELRDNGFGRSQCTARNDYIHQYLVTYQPRPRGERHAAAGPAAR
jgi:protein tyrosine phosphatase (PTP) superfamily phosphohydrolase (DUF442 family)